MAALFSPQNATASNAVTVLSAQSANALGTGNVSLLNALVTTNGGNPSSVPGASGTFTTHATGILEIGATLNFGATGGTNSTIYSLVAPLGSTANTINLSGGNGETAVGFAALGALRSVNIGGADALLTSKNAFLPNGGDDGWAFGSATANNTLVFVNGIDLAQNGNSPRNLRTIRGVGTVPEGMLTGQLSSNSGTGNPESLVISGTGGLILNNVANTGGLDQTYANGTTGTTANASYQFASGGLFVASNDAASASIPSPLGESTTALTIGTTGPGTGGLALGAINTGLMTYGTGTTGSNLTASITVARALTLGSGGTGIMTIGGFTADHTAFTGTIALGGANDPTLTAATGGQVDFTNVISGAAAGSQSLTFGNTIIEGTGTTFGSGTGISVAGGGIVNLTNTDTYTSATLINAGTVRLSGSGSINSSSGITINGAGAKLLQTSSVAVMPAITLTKGTLDASGTIGAVTVGAGTGGIIANGNGTATGVTMSSLNFTGAAAANLDVAGGSATAAALTVTGTLTNSTGPVTLNVTPIVPWNTGTTYNLIGYGSLTGSAANFAKGTVGLLSSRQTATVGSAGNNITITIGGDTPKWTGLDSTNWVVGATGANSNWQLQIAATATNYIDGDNVTFDDSASSAVTPGSVTISSANVSPTSTLFNNSTINYTLSGSFGIAGTGPLVKTGTASVTIGTVNSYSGGTIINGGTLSISKDANLGAVPAAPATNITLNGGSLQVTAGTAQPALTIATNRTIFLGASGGTLNIAVAGAGSYSGGTETAVIYAGTISGGNLTVSGGTGTNSGANPYLLELAASANANSYTGTTMINNATVSGSTTGGGFANVLPVGTVLTLANHGIYDLSTAAGNQTLAGLSGDNTTLIGCTNSGTTDTLTIDPALSQTYTYSGVVGPVTILDKTGTNTRTALTINGPGTEVLAGVNTYAGATTVTQGALSLSGTLGSGGGTAIAVASGATFTESSTGAIAGTSALTTSGTTTLAGANAYSGATLISAGTLQIGNGSTTGSLATGSAITDNATLTFNRTNTVTEGADFAATFTGSGSLVQAGSGTLILTGANGYTGSTKVNAGVLNLQSNGALGTTTGTTVSSGAALQLQGGIAIGNLPLTLNGAGLTASPAGALDNVGGGNSYAGSITLGSPTTIQSDFGTLSLTNAGLITGAGLNLTLAGGGNGSIAGGIGTSAGTLTKTGAGTWTLAGASTYSGGTLISAGTLALGGSGSINGSSGIAINGTGAKFLQTGSVASTPTITLTDGTLDGTGAVGAVTVGAGTGGIIANGNGSATALTISSLAFSGAATMNLNLAGGATTATPALTVSGALTNSTGPVTLNVTPAVAWVNGTTYNLIGYGSLTGALTNFAPGAMSLSGRQTATLGTASNFITITINGDSPKWTGLDSSSWQVGATGANSNWQLVTAGTPTNYIEGDAVLFDDSATSAVNPGLVTINGANVNPTSTAFNNSSINYTLNGSFGIAAGSLTKNGSAGLTINTVNSYSGATTIAAGTLTLGGTLGSGSGTAITSAATFIETTPGAIAGTSSLAVTGGTTSLAGVNTYTGATAVGAAGTLNLSGSIGAEVGTTISSAGTFSETSTGIIAGASTITVTGGTTTLAGANTYGGTAALQGGVLNLNNAAALSAGTLTISGGTIDNTSGAPMTLSNNPQTWSGNFTYGGTNNLNLGTGAVTLGSSVAVTASAGNLTVGGAISGAFGVTVVGPGTVTFTAGANTYSGGTTVNGGGALNVNFAATTTTETAGAASSPLGAVPATATAGNLTLNGGTLEFTNATAGATYNLSATRGIALGSLGGTLYTNTVSQTTFPTNVGNGLVYGGIITGGGGLTIKGNGSGLSSQGVFFFPIFGANQTGLWSYTGPTTIDGASVSYPSGGNQAQNLLPTATVLNIIDGGILNLCNTGSAQTIAGLTGTGTVGNTNSGSTTTLTISPTVGNSYTFSGVIAGAFSFEGKNGTSSVAVTKTGAGTEVFTGANTYTGATTINVGTLQLGAGGATGSLATGSAISDNATLAINRSNTATQGTDFAGTIGGTGSVMQAGAGALALTGANTYSGGTSLATGALIIGNLGTSPAASAIGTGTLTIANGTILDSTVGAGALATNNLQNWNGNFTFAGTSSLNLGTGAVTLGAANVQVTVNANTLTIGGAISGSGDGITLAGPGTLALSGTSTYTGATSVGATSSLNLSGTLGSTGGTVITSAGTLNETSTGVIAGASSLTVAGGTTSLAGFAHTYARCASSRRSARLAH